MNRNTAGRWLQAFSSFTTFTVMPVRARATSGATALVTLAPTRRLPLSTPRVAPSPALARTEPRAATLRTVDVRSAPRVGLRSWTRDQPRSRAVRSSSGSGLSATGRPTASSIGTSSMPLE
ncbi:hypothetical protein [Rhodococcus sp. SORGH_AS_0301]|uniref:hypothetical protein n=1 Tax=Rhodococcus sp. SORGH_AS_0301 TaxID=3041780 RepID=UPI0027D91B7E|nr:hypothetical protein [Rhodococcus sp. SORGH_AS_0301]